MIGLCSGRTPEIPMKRVPELDGLRAVAAALVIVFHFWPESCYFGWAGVDVFFVLSGYLITGIVLDYGAQRGFLRAFYMRRGLRTWPIYYLLIAALIVKRDVNWSALPYYLTYTQQAPRYFGWRMPLWFSMQHTWTLALEEQFYVLWPALLLGLGCNRNRTLAAALLIAATSAIARHFVPSTQSPWLLVERCDGFAMGGVLAVLARRPGPGLRRCAILAAVGTFAVALTPSVLHGALPFDDRLPAARPFAVTAATLASCAVVGAVVLGAGARGLAVLRVRPLVFLGVISYGLYLYHVPVLGNDYSLTRFGVMTHQQKALADITITIAAASLSWYLVERPILGLKRWFEYRER
jgi:peptidoglycan/LPS O-acetylase OafA/YrhL